jgi:hypothetical protein|tara:strand:- start:3568 stop:4341 length:774 start_codon:yes stop_codon:yes gene_type:complete
MSSINYNDVIVKLQDYMLSGTLITNNSRKDESLTNNNTATATKNTYINKNKIINNVDNYQQPRFYQPNEKDSLFWCFFMLYEGVEKYEMPGVRSFVNEKNLKFNYIEKIREQKVALKTYKIRNITEHVEDELANKQVIGMKTFIALCVAFNINVLFIHNRKCFPLILNDANKINVVHQKDAPKKHYVIENDTTDDQLDAYKNKYFSWESVDKPIKAISSYKVSELIDICKQLDLDKTNDLTKQNKKDLYEILLCALS